MVNLTHPDPHFGADIAVRSVQTLMGVDYPDLLIGHGLNDPSSNDMLNTPIRLTRNVPAWGFDDPRIGRYDGDRAGEEAEWHVFITEEDRVGFHNIEAFTIEFRDEDDDLCVLEVDGEIVFDGTIDVDARSEIFPTTALDNNERDLDQCLEDAEGNQADWVFSHFDPALVSGLGAHKFTIDPPDPSGCAPAGVEFSLVKQVGGQPACDP